MPAQLFPSDFDITELPASEKRALEILIPALEDDWIVVPKVDICKDGHDYEIDFLLISPLYGVFCFEVKGGVVSMADGRWLAYGQPMRDDPVDQVKKAKHALVRRLKASKVDLRGLFLQHAVAFPENESFPREGAGPSCPREMIFTKAELTFPVPAIQSLSNVRGPVPPTNLALFLKAVRPDVDEVEVTGTHVKGTRQRIDKATTEALRGVAEIDENTRVLIHGGAGTGKTFLAELWARRALARGEDTLFLCFNKILGQELLAGRDLVLERMQSPPNYVVGSFHAVITRMLGEDKPDVPEQADPVFWAVEFLRAFTGNINKIPDRFDTLIIDEGQDLQPGWLDGLSLLLKSPDTGRILMTADSRQAIFNEDWTPPREWTSLPLNVNLRNSIPIATALTNLGGPQPRGFGPTGIPVDFMKADGTKTALKRITAAIRRAHLDLQIPLSRIVILSRHRALRNTLWESEVEVEEVGSVPVVPWSQRNEDSVICETIHATKGIEREAVILVDFDETLDPTLTYVGASRAIIYLAVIGRDELGAQLGLVKK